MNANNDAVSRLAARIEALLWEASCEAEEAARAAGNTSYLRELERGRSCIPGAALDAARALLLGAEFGTAEEREFALSTPYSNLHAALGCKSVGHVAKAIVREFDK